MNKTEQFLRESNYIEGEYSEEAYQDALAAWNYLKDGKKLMENIVRQTHAFLMRSRDLEEKYKGAYRDIPVYIGGQEAIQATLIPSAMKEWLDKQNTEDWKAWHVEYEGVHPFVDGNGRTGRMFLNWHRLKLGLPLIVIKESEKHEYYKWFATK